MLIGRGIEVAEILTFLSADFGAPAALVITGDAGSGKTAVWRHALQAAGQPSRVLSCQPVPAERPLAFSALDDLFGEIPGEVLSALAEPRRHAVEAALLRSPPPGAYRVPPDQRVLARGILETLQVLGDSHP